MGPDEMHPMILRELTDVFSEPFSIIFQKLWKSSKVPRNDGWKEDPGNYRPFRLTCMCSKIMDQILLEHLLKYMKHMEDRELIKDSQHGFPKDKSCLTNFVVFSDGLTESMDKGRAIDATYLDICKAFDMVPPNTIISELKKYRFDAWTVRWTSIWLDGCV